MKPDLSSVIADIVVEAVVEMVGAHEPGHCIRIDELPTATALIACRRLQDRIAAPDLARYVTRDPSTAWQVSPTQAVSLRNLSETPGSIGVLVVFIAPDARLSVEDSIGASTFELVRFPNLRRDAISRTLSTALSTNPQGGAVAEIIARELLRDARYGCDEFRVADYLLSVAESDGPGAAGRALVKVGLLPDRSVAELGSDQLRRRLAVNNTQMEALESPADPSERIRNLPVDRKKAEGRIVIETLRDALTDGITDRFAIGERLLPSADEVDLADWDLESTTLMARRFEIIDLYGEFDRTNTQEPTIRRADPSVGVRFVCEPAPSGLPGVRSMRLDVLEVGRDDDDLHETGVGATKSTLPRKSSSTWKRRLDIEEDGPGLGPGLYRFRLSLIADDNFQASSALSPVFRVGEDLAEKSSTRRPVLGITDAAVAAIAAGVDPLAAARPNVSIVQPDTPAWSITHDGSSTVWTLAQPRLLADLETQTLKDPSLRGFVIGLGEDLGTEDWLQAEGELPEQVGAARARLFERVLSAQYIADSPFPSFSTADLSLCHDEVTAYVNAWSTALQHADHATTAALLSMDQTHVLENGEPIAVLVGPAHPVRLSWLTRCQTLLGEWVNHARDLPEALLPDEATELSEALDRLVPANLPPTIKIEDRHFRSTDSLTRGWGLWTPAEDIDPTATTGRIRDWLDLPSWRLDPTGETELVSRTKAYLAAHPYVRRLVINVVQPGEAELVLRLLAQLQADDRYGDLTFVLRLFGDHDDPALGRALDVFMSDPEAASGLKRDAAEALTRPSTDPLAPKLSYSKHDISDIVNRPEQYPAHLSVFLDWFTVQTTTLPEAPDGRSLFAGGLLVEPIQRFTRGNDQRPPCWINAVATKDIGELPDAIRALQHGTARVMGGLGIDPVPVLLLEIDSVQQAVIDAVHRSSDWVVIIDQVFSDEFLDSPPAEERTPRYVIDMQSAVVQSGGRNVVVSSLARDEQASPMLAMAARLGITLPPDAGATLMRSLHALGSGVALRLLMNEGRAKEALSLAIATAHLQASGLLRHALAVPIDLHRDLFTESRARGATPSASRTDLALFQMDPDNRRIGVHLVEVKLRSSLGAGNVPAQLADEIHEQLVNTETVLMNRLFAAQLRREPSSLPGALQLRRLTVLLRRYLRRAVRHSLVDESEGRRIAEFIESLQSGFQVGSSLHGFVFHVADTDLKVEDHGNVQLTVAGRRYLERLLGGDDHHATELVGDDHDHYLRTVFGTIRDWSAATVDPESAGDQPPADEPAVLEEMTPATDGQIPGPAPDTVDILGINPSSGQFGILGRHGIKRRPVAIDMEGTNVVSVFGVQGSGKSYTVGNILEAALIQDPALNRLPAPLGAALFHYSADKSYEPEFVAMQHPNQTPVADRLTDYATTARGLTDVLVLVPQALLNQRRGEYGTTPVEPIMLGPEELQLGDWKLLMGISEGNQMYAKALSSILGDLRDHITLDGLRAAIQGSALGTAQKSTALQRIKFVEPYVLDGARLSAHLRPGRLVIVDLRDELIDKGEALSLFMVMLNRFTEASYAGRSFNKIIVFDEAHKYMDDRGLTAAITETVREMRHKGTSIVVASQNPPSVPQEIIELSSIIITHRFTSPAWLKHLQKVSHAFADMRGSQFTTLTPGEALVWANGNSLYVRPQRVEMRPRLTQHGGATRRATDDRT